MLGIVLGIWSILVNITRIFTLLELKWQVSVYHMCCATYIYDLCHIMFIACILLETYEYLKSFSSLQAVGDQRMMGSSSFWFRRKQNQEYTFRRNIACMVATRILVCRLQQAFHRFTQCLTFFVRHCSCRKKYFASQITDSQSHICDISSL